jgi:hypothetical protein
MNVKRSISIISLTATTALAAAGLAGAAEQAHVSEQHTIAGAAPVTIPGTGIHQGDWMGSRAVAIYRDVELEPGQRARITLKAQNGRRIRGVALSDEQLVGSRVENRDYVGKGAVTVTVSRSSKAPAGEETVTVYALTK